MTARRVLLLNRWFQPEVFGGTETALYDLAQGLRREGVDVRVVCETRSLPTGWQTVDGIRVFRHEGAPVPRLHWSLRTIDVYANILRWLRRLRPELEDLPIISRTYWYAAAARTVFPRARIIYYCPGTGRLYERSELDGLSGRARAWAVFEMMQSRVIERRALRGANLVVTDSAHCRRDLVREYKVNPRRVRVFRTGVDLELFRPRPFDHDLAAELGLTPATPIILSVARLAPMKNHAFLVRAFARMRSAGAVLVLLGDGPEMGRLRRLAVDLGVKDRVLFPGFRRDVPRFLTLATAFVLPSTYEPYGIVWAEALACGIPSLALWPGPQIQAAGDEHIVHGENGFLVEPHNKGDLAAKLDLLVADAEVRRRMAAAARQIALERYDWRATVRDFLAALDSNAHQAADGLCPAGEAEPCPP